VTIFRRVFLVAIAEPGASAPDRLGALAADLGTTLYELKLTLNAGFPAVVLATVDEDKAVQAARTISRHGHRAVTVDRRRIVDSAHMTALRDFALEPDAVLASKARRERLPYDDIALLLKASHRTSRQTTEEVKERKLGFSGSSLVTGLPMPVTTTREVTTTTVEHEQVLYLFRTSGATPFILRKGSAIYTALGANLRPTAIENFATTIRLLRERAPGAKYDERLMTSRPIRGVADGVAATDLYAHLLAASSR